jgi:hypothetical protein
MEISTFHFADISLSNLVQIFKSASATRTCLFIGDISLSWQVKALTAENAFFLHHQPSNSLQFGVICTNMDHIKIIQIDYLLRYCLFGDLFIMYFKISFQQNSKISQFNLMKSSDCTSNQLSFDPGRNLKIPICLKNPPKMLSVNMCIFAWSKYFIL